MKMLCCRRVSWLLAVASALSAPPSAAAASSSTALGATLDASYVVQLHSTREGYTPPSGPLAMRSQFMTTESGQQFECFLPPLPTESEADFASDSEDAPSNDEEGELDAAEREKREQLATFLTFGRAAARKVRPKCVQYVDKETNWVYELCPGVLVRRVSLKTRAGPSEQAKEVVVDASGAASNPSESGARHEVVELGAFIGDSSSSALSFDEFAVPETQDRVKNHRKPLFTQSFGLQGKTDPRPIQVQFICSATARDDAVAGVQWRGDDPKGGPREVAAFLVASRVFCDPQHSDADDNDLFTVRSLLQPLADAHTCVTRNEGWWTYEFCFGRKLRQYHRDGDGRITAEFSLGSFDSAGNQELESSGAALVSEHIDATHDVSRPAYLELYDYGTFCREFESHAPRKARVFYYCSQGGTSHHILTVKETQTCSYTVKVSSPVLCDHPHFLNDEQRSDAQAEILHCIPVVDEAQP